MEKITLVTALARITVLASQVMEKSGSRVEYEQAKAWRDEADHQLQVSRQAAINLIDRVARSLAGPESETDKRNREEAERAMETNWSWPRPDDE